MAHTPGGRCSVRQSLLNVNRWFFDFDQAAVGGKGGASVLLDTAQGLASVDGVHRNDLLPKRSTGSLLAEGMALVGMPRPAIVEAYNVDKKTVAVLATGGNGQGTVLGNMLEDAAKALGATILRWEPVPDGKRFHLRIHVRYP